MRGGGNHTLQIRVCGIKVGLHVYQNGNATLN